MTQRLLGVLLLLISVRAGAEDECDLFWQTIGDNATAVAKPGRSLKEDEISKIWRINFATTDDPNPDHHEFKQIGFLLNHDRKTALMEVSVQSDAGGPTKTCKFEETQSQYQEVMALAHRSTVEKQCGYYLKDAAHRFDVDFTFKDHEDFNFMTFQKTDASTESDILRILNAALTRKCANPPLGPLAQDVEDLKKIESLQFVLGESQRYLVRVDFSYPSDHAHVQISKKDPKSRFTTYHQLRAGCDELESAENMKLSYVTAVMSLLHSEAVSRTPASTGPDESVLIQTREGDREYALGGKSSPERPAVTGMEWPKAFFLGLAKICDQKTQ